MNTNSVSSSDEKKHENESTETELKNNRTDKSVYTLEAASGDVVKPIEESQEALRKNNGSVNFKKAQQNGVNQQYMQQGMNPQYMQQRMNQQYPQQGMNPQYMQQNGMNQQYPQQGMNQQYMQQGMNQQYPQQGMNPQYMQQNGMNQQYVQQGMNPNYQSNMYMSQSRVMNSQYGQAVPMNSQFMSGTYMNRPQMQSMGTAMRQNTQQFIPDNGPSSDSDKDILADNLSNLLDD